MLTYPTVDCPVRKRTETSAKVPLPRELEHAFFVLAYALLAKTAYMRS